MRGKGGEKMPGLKVGKYFKEGGSDPLPQVQPAGPGNSDYVAVEGWAMMLQRPWTWLPGSNEEPRKVCEQRSGTIWPLHCREVEAERAGRRPQSQSGPVPCSTPWNYRPLWPAVAPGHGSTTPVQWGATIAPRRVAMGPAVTMGVVGPGLEPVPLRRSLMFESPLRAVFSLYQERVKPMRPTQDFRAGMLLSVICF